MTPDFPRRFLIGFAMAGAFMWTLLPSLFFRVLPLDTLEAVTWGRFFSLGNYKHPPFSGYLAYTASYLGGHADWPLFLLSQLLVLVAFYYTYKLAREFFDSGVSSIAVLFLSFALFYNLYSVKFNVNTLEMAFWPMTACYFYRAVRHNRMSDWLLLGLAAALNVLSKYFGLLLLFSLFCFFWSDREARRRLTGCGLYVSALLFLLLISPHVYWLWDHDFMPFHYVEERLHDDGHNRWFAPLRAVGLLLYPLLSMAAAAVVALLLSDNRPYPSRPEGKDAAAVKFALFCMGIPASVMLVMAFCGSYIDNLWSYPIYFPGGMLLAALFRKRLTPGFFRAFAILAVVLSFIIMAGYSAYSLGRSKDRRNLEPAVVAAFAREFYREKRGADIPGVCGSMWEAGMLQRELGFSVPLCVLDDPLEASRFGLKDGDLLVGEYPALLRDCAVSCGAEEPEFTARDFYYSSLFGKPGRITLYFAVVKLKSAAE